MKSTADKKRWQADYHATTEALETIRARNLAAMTDEQCLQIIETLNSFEQPWSERPNWSGLVEQQRLFHQRRKP